jgi:D-galactarolactone isomerase
MNERRIGRRTFLQRASLAAFGAAGLFDARVSHAQVAVPNSTGTELPKLKALPLACDCHHHIYDTARFPAPKSGAEPNSTVTDYRLLQKRIGTTRDVIVTPRPYATDNRVTLDAIAQFGANARALRSFTLTLPTPSWKHWRAAEFAESGSLCPPPSPLR